MDTVNSVYSYVEHTVSMYYCVHVENYRKSYFVVGAHKDFAFFFTILEISGFPGFSRQWKRSADILPLLSLCPRNKIGQYSKTLSLLTCKNNEDKTNIWIINNYPVSATVVIQ